MPEAGSFALLCGLRGDYTMALVAALVFVRPTNLPKPRVAVGSVRTAVCLVLR
jgi:CO/xanthine dehydrogenase FAD-binding subunit